MTVEVKRRDKVSTLWTAHGMDLRTGTNRLLARAVTAAEDADPIILPIAGVTFAGGNSIVEHVTEGTLAPGTYYVELEHSPLGGGGPYTFRPEGASFDLLVVLPDLG